jgi:hypothetical protein
LPSYADAINTSYNFIPNASYWDTNRAKHVTDYAKATGAFANMSQYDGNFANGIWMLRSPANSASYFIRECYYNGEITDGGININLNAHGVVPMLTLRTIEYGGKTVVVEKQVGNSSTYRFNYSALLNIKQDAVVHRNYEYQYAGSYLSVPKTYFEVGEDIPVSYSYQSTYDCNRAWICIATTGEEEKRGEYFQKDSYILWKYVTKGSKDTFNINEVTENSSQGSASELRDLPEGEYKIWFMYDNEWWTYDNDQTGTYNNPYITGNAITEPISIKIIDPKAPDYSLQYKAWCGEDDNKDYPQFQMEAMYSYIELERNTFVQGEPIKMKFNGRTQYMCAFLVDSAGNVREDTITGATEMTGVPQELDGWTEYYEMKNSRDLTPGKYRLYYAVENDLENVYRCGAIVTILDIIILPKDVEAAPTSKLDVIYTNTSGHITRKTINESVALNGLLNSHPDNENLVYNEKGEIISPVAGIVELTDVMPNSTIQFVFTYPGDLNIVPKIDEVNLDYEIKKGALKVSNKFSDATYNNVYISVPKTYYTEGETITVTFNTVNVANPRILLTVDTKGTVNRYGDIWIRASDVNKQNGGTIDISNRMYDMSNTVDLKYIESNTKWNVDELPPGEYKIWLYDTDNDSFAGTTYEMYRAESSHLVTEPISIKILPKDDITPDYSITHHSDWNYSGTHTDGGENWSSLTIDKTVFKKGEKIYYEVEGSWEHKWVAIFEADKFSTGDYVENLPEKDKTIRYAQYGHEDSIDQGKNFLLTDDLDPGQYKIVYVFGYTLEDAWKHTSSAGFHNGNYQKIMTIIDITIVE